jgi:hypothetical protein
MSSATKRIAVTAKVNSGNMAAHYIRFDQYVLSPKVSTNLFLSMLTL